MEALARLIVVLLTITSESPEGGGRVSAVHGGWGKGQPLDDPADHH